MKKSLQVLSGDYAAIRAGRANPAVLDKIVVDYYGAPTPIPQMAAVSVAEARVLVVQPWDLSTLKSIEKAIQTSDLGINPTNDGKVLRIAFPQLTEERRRDIVKEVSKLCEEAKVATVSYTHLDVYKRQHQYNHGIKQFGGTGNNIQMPFGNRVETARTYSDFHFKCSFLSFCTNSVKSGADRNFFLLLAEKQISCYFDSSV